MLRESTKERIKLLANALNALAVNSAIAGVVVPLVAILYGLGTKPTIAIVPAIFIWPTVAVVLHLTARTVLKDLDP